MKVLFISAIIALLSFSPVGDESMNEFKKINKKTVEDVSLCGENATLIDVGCIRECYSVRRGITGNLGFDAAHAGEWVKPNLDQLLTRASFLESLCD